jgi:hypothetical protein
MAINCTSQEIGIYNDAVFVSPSGWSDPRIPNPVGLELHYGIKFQAEQTQSNEEVYSAINGNISLVEKKGRKFLSIENNSELSLYYSMEFIATYDITRKDISVGERIAKNRKMQRYNISY